MGNELVGRADMERMQDNELDLPGIWSAIVRKKKLIGAVTLVSLLGAAVFLAVVKPRYTGEVKLIVENQESYFTRPDKATSDQSASPDSEAIASQVQLITSREIAREAIKRLNLVGKAEFDPRADGESMSARILGLIGLSKPRPQIAGEDRLFERYGDKLTVFQLPKSRVITVEFNSNDPELAARGANTISDIYLEQQAKNKREQASLAAASIGAIVNELRTKLAEAEAKVETFRSNSGLLQGSTSATISNQQLGELSTQLAAARNTMADAQAKSRLIRGVLQRSRLDEVSDVAKDDLVRRLAEQRSSLRARISLEARTLGPSHPRMQELNAQVATIESELRTAAERSARALENDARIANTRVENILAAIESEKRRVGGTGNDQAQLREHELEAKLVREQLEANTVKYREALARQQAASTPSDARIISRAVVPEKPTFPKTVPILLFALLGGLILSLAGVVAAELLSGRALRPVPIAPIALAPGIAPSYVHMQMPGSGSVVTEKDPMDALNPSLARLAKRFMSAETTDYGMRVLVCSGVADIDAGFSIEPFARAIASKRRAILVDFGGRVLENASGLHELLAGSVGFSDIIERDGGSRLHLVGRGSADVTPGPELDAVIDALSQTYDFVLMLAPQDDVGHSFAMSMAPAADKALIVIGDGGNRDDVRDLQQALVSGGAGDVVIIEDAQGRAPANDARAPAHAA